MIQVQRELAIKVRWRLVIPTILFIFLSSLDRANVSFAALQMNVDLGFSPATYGFGAGILFFGYLAGQYPSILLCQKYGFKLWISGLAVVWGAASATMAFIHTPMEFYVIRVIIGIAEGGLAPGIVLYLSQFATEKERATTFALPMLAIPLSIILGGPLSGYLLDMQAPGEMAGWRWMFLAEGTPTILLGLASLFYFPNTPREAKWLTNEEKNWLAANSTNHTKEGEKPINDWSVIMSPIVWASALLWFCLLAGAYGIMFWLPQVVQHMSGLSAFEIGLVNALPWMGVGLGVYFNSAHSDKTGERFWHIGLPSAISALAIIAATASGYGVLSLSLLFIAGLGLGAAQGAFWALPTALFTPASMAIGVVTINIAGNTSGAIISQIIGYIREQSGGYFAPILLVASLMFCASVIVLLIRLKLADDRVREAN
ncbi:MFS transporter [Emcibacter sp.]|uniref:MFS transporter n=1 Tax=Emcibacter sp. TaxID=1979954 RepID=UPI002AA74AE7|nr:MFS transporter [Emcibacter sp.]